MRSRDLRTVQEREQPLPPSKHPLNDRTPEGREEILRRMRVVSAKFYAGAISAGCHAFIEFAGLLNEFIAVCQRAEEQDLPWARANVHGGVHLPFEPHNIDYLNEKLGCIYGLQLAGRRSDTGEIEKTRDASKPQPVARDSLGRGLLWGQLLTGLEAACTLLVQARRAESLLPAEDQRRLVEAIDGLRGLEQRAWGAQVDEARRLTKPRSAANRRPRRGAP